MEAALTAGIGQGPGQGEPTEGGAMRYFELLNVQHFVLYLFPALATILVFAVGLGYHFFRHRDSDAQLSRIIEEYPGGIQGRNAPFPLVLILVIAGTVAWSLAYILLIGFLEVRI
jgi:hypothetical protein